MNPVVLAPIEGREAAAPQVSTGRSNFLRLRLSFWTAAVVLGLLQVYAQRFEMNSDGIAYLDMGDAYFRGDWHMAVNAYWSPVYAWLLGLAMVVVKPSPYWEFPTVQLVNAMIYLGTAVAFDFFLRSLTQYHRSRASEHSRAATIGLPCWAITAIGIPLFLWSSLQSITVPEVHPDLCVALLVYVAAGLVVRIRTGDAGLLNHVALGLVLGLGYLAKTPMFPMAFVFLGVAMLAGRDRRRSAWMTLAALACFLMLAGPLVFAISQAKGRFTIGDSGGINYAKIVNESSAPAPAVSDPGRPEIEIFGGTSRATNPRGYDPSLARGGVAPSFSVKAQLQALLGNARNYYYVFSFYSAWLACLIALFVIGGRKWRALRDMSEQWFVLVPALAAMAMYWLVWVEARYVAPFVVLFLMGVLPAIRLPASRESLRLVEGLVVALVVTTSFSVAPRIAFDFYEGRTDASRTHWLVADALRQLGVVPGETVVSLESPFNAFWARLARTPIVAGIPRGEDLDRFWAADSVTRSEFFEVFERTGATAVVADAIPPGAAASGWRRLGETGYYAYLLRDGSR